ncbi:hypothetical protein MMC26_004397 [Xylographa opegraphella]|nr:hypothetical protein [Xylographa opegraphella]
MTILFESSSDILKNGLVVPQHPAEKNLLSINTAPTAQIGNHTTEKKQKRDEQIGANIHLDARLIRKERRRVGFEVDYYTNTRTGEYRVLSYPISVRERVLASEVFPKDLRIELLRRIPGYMKPIPETLDGCASSEGKKSRKRSYSAAVVEEIGAADTPRTAIPSANAALVARRPVGRPRKRLATGIIGLETTSSLSTTATPIAAPPGDIFLGHVVKDQPCPTIRSDTRTVIGRNQSQEPSSPTCTESYLHPITGEEQLDLEHEGKVILCDNKRRHDPKNRGEDLPGTPTYAGSSPLVYGLHARSEGQIPIDYRSQRL